MSPENATKLESTAKERLYSLLTSIIGMNDVESLIKSKLVSDAELLREIPTYLLELGGKRVRPLLTLLTSRLFGMKSPDERVKSVAAGIELIHMATLLHDDIIDKSPMRRKKESPLLKYGVGDTLLTGDFLLVRAFSLCSKLDTFIIDATEKACVELTEGEILEKGLHERKHSIDTSIEIAQKKTASLFRLASESGAHLALSNAPNGDDEIVPFMASFGENLGIAFQMVDDILDVTSPEDLLGKKSGTDLKERKPSLVNVLWLASGSTLSQRLIDPNVEIDVTFIDAAMREIKASGIVEEAKRIALSYADCARSDLQTAMEKARKTDSVSEQALNAIIDYCVERME